MVKSGRELFRRCSPLPPKNMKGSSRTATVNRPWNAPLSMHVSPPIQKTIFRQHERQPAEPLLPPPDSKKQTRKENTECRSGIPAAPSTPRHSHKRFPGAETSNERITLQHLCILMGFDTHNRYAIACLQGSTSPICRLVCAKQHSEKPPSPDLHLAKYYTTRAGGTQWLACAFTPSVEKSARDEALLPGWAQGLGHWCGRRRPAATYPRCSVSPQTKVQ